ncbi:type IV toxin-antitoxin system AbiEi family antitoxin domain-containing protein [uncultured Corynebacterium sp.]|uniref:type IV toxin-antitoxin system AbiEi family antitoxin domain-containing protein n=1 Tax=uncultured Corynebacterium sp. TaxID=159447 RepID=UPI0025EB761B|nr:type IV toxin-antitoxin system AbiEi family antitoxin domain-containing protein [uncultured Corynebacterium sp.]
MGERISGDIRGGGLANATSTARIGDRMRRAELMADGLSRLDLDRADDGGWLVREGRGTYRLAVDGVRLRLELVALRSPAVVFSHRIAAHAHGMLKNPPRRLDVIVPRDKGKVVGARTWRRTAVQCVTIDGLPFASVAETLADLVGEWGIEVTANIVDARFPTPASREPIIADVAALPRARRRAIERIVGWVPENMFSKIEGRIARALQLRGYVVVLNFAIGPYTWDIVHVRARLIIEFDSRKFHDDSQSFRTDRARQNNAIRRGWAILRYIDDDVELRFDRFIDEICSTIDWLLGEPLAASEWDERRCQDLYVDLQVKWEARQQAAWPHW